MTAGKTWSAVEKAKALELDRAGLSYAEVGRALDRSPRAVQCMIERSGTRAAHSNYDGPPIAYCEVAARLQRNAISGSAELRETIYRVFGA